MLQQRNKTYSQEAKFMEGPQVFLNDKSAYKIRRKWLKNNFNNKIQVLYLNFKS